MSFERAVEFYEFQLFKLVDSRFHARVAATGNALSPISCLALCMLSGG